MSGYVFEAELYDYPGIGARLALAGSDTLVALHELLREAFGWEDPHLYSFWLDGEFWGNATTEYTSPDELEPGQRSAEVALDSLGLQPGQQIAYIFDFGDSWHVLLSVAELAAEGPPPTIVERRGDPPPQYPDFEEDETGGSE